MKNLNAKFTDFAQEKASGYEHMATLAYTQDNNDARGDSLMRYHEIYRYLAKMTLEDAKAKAKASRDKSHEWYMVNLQLNHYF